MPQAGSWQAEIKVPTSTIAQIGPGQEVRMTLPAYPVQDYGVLRGIIQQVGAAPIEDGQPYFLVTVKLDPLTARQRERGIVLRSELALEAHIVLARRSFVQWLFDPLTAVARR